MNTWSRIGVLFMLGLMLGLPLGAYLTQNKFIRNEKTMGMWSEENFADDFAKKEFAFGDPQSAREALLYAIEIHKQMQATSPSRGWPQKWDLGWCYGELSLLEQAAGNADVARNDLAQAEEIFKELGRMDYFDAHIQTEREKRHMASPPMSSSQP
jgi:hypothetical protein